MLADGMAGCCPKSENTHYRKLASRPRARAGRPARLTGNLDHVSVAIFYIEYQPSTS